MDWGIIIVLISAMSKMTSCDPVQRAYVGCFLDPDPEDRDMDILMKVDSAMTIERCTSLCYIGQYKYAGLQAGNQCWCGNSFGKHEDSRDWCYTPCRGDTSQYCGGSNANNVYQTKLDGYYLGCQVLDVAQDSISSSTMDPGECITHCASRARISQISALKNGNECYCTSAPESVRLSAYCTSPCAGNDSLICGGEEAFSVYSNEYKGNITRKEGTKLRSQEKYTFVCTGKDSGIPSKEAEVSVRIDTFPPDEVVVTFNLSLTLGRFMGWKDEFLYELGDILSIDYPRRSVKLWKTTTRQVVTGINSNRRRRATDTVTDYVRAYVYAIADNKTDLKVNLNSPKTFLTTQELLTYWQSNSADKIPSSYVLAKLDKFNVQSVDGNIDDESVAWETTTTGLAVIIFFSILGLIILVVVIVVVVYCIMRRKPKRPVTPVQERATIVEDTGAPKPAKSMNKKGLIAPSVVAIPQPRPKPKTAARLEAWEDSDDDQKMSTSWRRNSMTEYDGKAIDPATGKLYYYNTRTNERKWADPSSPPPKYTPTPPRQTALHQ